MRNVHLVFEESVPHGTRARLRPGRRLVLPSSWTAWIPRSGVALAVDAPGAELLLRRKSGLPLPAPLRRVRLQLLHDAQPGRRAASAGVPALPGHRRRRLLDHATMALLLEHPAPSVLRSWWTSPQCAGFPHAIARDAWTLIQRVTAGLASRPPWTPPRQPRPRGAKVPTAGIRRADRWRLQPRARRPRDRAKRADQPDGSADAAQPRCCATRPRPLRDMRWR